MQTSMPHTHPRKEQAALSHTQALQVAKVQMVKGEREGWRVPLHPLSLEECGAADSASLLASLAAEKPSVSTSSSLATISNLAITPERVAKVMGMNCTLSGMSSRNLSTWQSLVQQEFLGSLLSASGTV